MHRRVTSLGDLIKVVKELNEAELTSLLLRILSSNSYKVRKNSLVVVKRILNENGIQLSDELINSFIGSPGELAGATS